MNIIEKMTVEALTFMHKRKKIEDKLSKEMLDIIAKIMKEIEKILKGQPNINISLIPSFISNEIKPLIDEYMKEQHQMMNKAIRDNFEIGIENGQKLLQLSNEYVPPYNKEIKDSSYEEVLIALLLYGERLIDSLGADLTNNLNKDLTSIYISGKNARERNNQKEVKSNNNSTLNTIIGGSIIAKYINPTFKNITNRADMIARNESNRSLNHGHMMRYLRASDDMKGLMVKWIEVRDTRVCHHCQEAASGGEFANGVYPIDDVTPPPLHSRCRCILIPFMAKWYE